MEQFDLVPLWKALAEPKRRRIIELLHLRPHTTGELCTFFDVSRFAIMQHLKVLEGANLIETRRDGRQRWNSLNEGLFQQIQQDYIEEDSVESGYRFQDVLRLLLGQERVRRTPARGFVEVTIMLNATIGEVFQAITQDIDAWWSRRRSVTSAMYLEPFVGGRLYEAFGSDNHGILYATVVSVQAPKELILSGLMGMVDEVVTSTIHIILEAENEVTRLKLVHRFSKNVTKATIKAFEQSWNAMLAGDLKQFVEEKIRFQSPEQTANHESRMAAS
jgi:DNA-binding transcriptional ArsR family regulator